MGRTVSLRGKDAERFIKTWREANMEPSTGDWFQTYSGRAYHPLDPNPNEVDLIDIAHGLAYQCRFNGQCRSFYSVAEHSFWVSEIMYTESGKPGAALAGLLHDAAEAYIGDMVRPIKRSLPRFYEIERLNMMAIYAGLKVPVEAGMETWAEAIKEADLVMLATERRELMSDPPMPWVAVERVEALDMRLFPLSPEQAERKFIARFNTLMGAIELMRPERL